MARYLIVVCLLADGLVVPSAYAANGEGFFSISVSNDVEFLDVTAVDPDTLLPLSGTFTSNAAGEYFLQGLVILDGDTANPIGDFEISGQGDPRFQTTFRWIIEEPFKPPGIVLFASFISGIAIEEPTYKPYEQLQTLQSVTATGDPGTPPADPSAYASIYVETADGKSANAVDAGVGGVFAIPGTTDFDSGVVNLPDLPAETTEDHFSVLVIQNDIGLFDVVESTGVTLTSTVHTHILTPPTGIPGDYNNNGVVDAADYPVWRDNLGAPEGTLLNDPNSGPIGAAQYGTWVSHFGETTPAALVSDAVPEPSAAWLTCCGCFLAAVFLWAPTRNVGRLRFGAP